MRSVVVNILLAFIAPSYAHDQVHDEVLHDNDNLVNIVVDKLFNRVLKASPLQHADMDSAMLGKPAHPAMHTSSGLRPMPFSRPILRNSISPAAVFRAAAISHGPGPVRAEESQTQSSMNEAYEELMKDKDLTPEMKKKLEDAMKDPEKKKQMEAMSKMMATPGMAQQMQMMQQVAQSEAMQKKIAELQSDPEMKPMFEKFQKALKEKGPGAIMQFYNDPEFLSKLGQKIGDTPFEAIKAAQESAPAAAPGGAPPPPPEVKTILDAAKYNDKEALEDFLAIGKDVNDMDNEKRTPLHFVSGAGHADLVAPLLEAGASVTNVDTKGNTPLHYAAGYGRLPVVEKLLNAGASVETKNANGKTPVEVARMNPNNPLLANAALMTRLDGGAAPAAALA